MTQTASQSNYYDLLGLSRTATAAEVQLAFRRCALALDPARNADKPEVAAQLRAFTRANQVLSDPAQRAQYDAMLAIDLSALWVQVDARFFAQTTRYTQALDAVRAAIPLAVEEMVLVLGLATEHAHLSSYLVGTDVGNLIRRLLAEVSGQPLTYRVINGATRHDWETLKADEEAGRRHREALQAGRVAPPPVGTVWESCQESLNRAWEGLGPRSASPLARAQFVQASLKDIARTAQRARADGATDEAVTHQIDRLLARLAGLLTLDPAILALAYLRE